MEYSKAVAAANLVRDSKGILKVRQKVKMLAKYIKILYLVKTIPWLCIIKLFYVIPRRECFCKSALNPSRDVSFSFSQGICTLDLLNILHLRNCSNRVGFLVMNLMSTI